MRKSLVLIVIIFPEVLIARAKKGSTAPARQRIRIVNRNKLEDGILTVTIPSKSVIVPEMQK